MIARRLIVVIVALLLAIEIVRNSAVAALAPLRPESAARLWPDHPSVEIALGLTDIGRAARERTAINRNTFAMIDDAAIKSPLSPEPFLVRGVQAQMNGEGKKAMQAFLAAQWRDPRSMPAAYFLANYFFRTSDAIEGLEQTTVLARLSPAGTAAAAPFVAAYAQDRSNWAQMRALFNSQPGLENAVLTAMAHNARNTDAVLALADADHRKPDSDWLSILLSSLIANGDYPRARAIWAEISDSHVDGDLVFDPTFSAPDAPPPFNWTLASSTIGLAERQSGKRLHVIFYGNEDGVLASQLVLLPAGTYQLQMRLAGPPVHPEALRWSIRCDKSTEPFASVGIDEASRSGWSFEVPAECAAQRLELSGRSGDIAQQSEAEITALSLKRSGNHA